MILRSWSPLLIHIVLCVRSSIPDNVDPLQSVTCEFNRKRTFNCRYTTPIGNDSLLYAQSLFCNNPCKVVTDWGTGVQGTGSFVLNNCRGRCNNCLALRLKTSSHDDNTAHACTILRPLDFIKPGPVRDLKVSNKSMTSLLVTWIKPDDYDNLDEKYIYAISLKTDQETKSCKKTSRKESLCRDFKKLKAWTRVAITIEARFSSGGLVGEPVYYTYSRPTMNVTEQDGGSLSVLPILLTGTVIASVVIVLSLISVYIVYRNRRCCELELIVLPDIEVKESSFSYVSHIHLSKEENQLEEPNIDSVCTLTDSPGLCTDTIWPPHTKHGSLRHAMLDCCLVESCIHDLKSPDVSLNECVQTRLSQKRTRWSDGSCKHRTCHQDFPVSSFMELGDFRLKDKSVEDKEDVDVAGDADADVDADDEHEEDVDVSGMSTYRHVPVVLSDCPSITEAPAGGLQDKKCKTTSTHTHSSSLSLDSDLSDDSQASVDSYTAMTFPFTFHEGVGCVINSALSKENIKRNSVQI